MFFSRIRQHLPLVALFLLALPVFLWLRWEPQAWFAGQLTENGLGGTFNHATVEKSFPGLAIVSANISLPDGNKITFDKILLRPAIFATLSGKPALFFRAERAGMTAQGVFSATDEKLSLNHIDIHAEAEKLAVFDARLQLLGLHGTLQLNGNIDLQRSDGMPLTG
ncbi:MAG: hypothetical protein R8K53_09670, partial [Mariprofundaceae bacterium]